MGFTRCNRCVALGVLGFGTTTEADCPYDNPQCFWKRSDRTRRLLSELNSVQPEGRRAQAFGPYSISRGVRVRRSPPPRETETVSLKPRPAAVV